MRQVNVIFAAVFAAALLVGGINMFTAVDAGVDVDKKGAVDVVGASCVRPPVDKGKKPAVERSRDDRIDKEGINTVRRGRRIQVDGFLLEWRVADANVWPGSNWWWDAVGTIDGVAGYVSLPARIGSGVNRDSIDTVDNTVNDTVSINTAAPPRPDWVFTLRAANTGRSLEIKLPGLPAGEFFAFDKGAFDAGGPLTAEWIIPWDFFDAGADDDADVYTLSINAVGAGVGALPPLVLSVAAPGEPRAPAGLLTRLALAAVAAALTAALVVIRRRQMREKHLI